jgi:hypothetical protein
VDGGQSTGIGGLANMPGSEGGVTDEDAFRMKRQRMQDGATGLEDMLAGSAAHTSGSSNQLQDLAAGAAWQQSNNSNRMVEGNDLTQVYEQARQQAQQEQQQAMMGMGGFGDVPINSLQQPGGMMMSGRYNLSQNNSMRLQRLDRYGGPPNSFGRPPLTTTPSAAGPARLTTGHKHEAYLQNIMQKKFSSNPMAQAAGMGGPTMITRNYGQYMQTASPGGYYQRFQGYAAPPVRKPQTADDDADHLLNRCEEVRLVAAVAAVLGTGLMAHLGACRTSSRPQHGRHSPVHPNHCTGFAFWTLCTDMCTKPLPAMLMWFAPAQ